LVGRVEVFVDGVGMEKEVGGLRRTRRWPAAYMCLVEAQRVDLWSSARFPEGELCDGVPGTLRQEMPLVLGPRGGRGDSACIRWLL
jgi:hypothetical protein